MSTAEITAHNIYERYMFDTLPDEVKHHLAILFISSSLPKGVESQDYPSYGLPMMSEEEKCDSLKEALADAKEGRVVSCEDVHRRMEERYTWLNA